MMNHIVNDMEKLLSITGYLDEILFERQYRRIDSQYKQQP